MRILNKFFSKAKTKRERGMAILMAALGMTVFFGAAGLAIDISHLYLAGAELQNAADASALAGASAFNNAATGITEARNRAVSMVNKYEFGRLNVSITPSNLRYGRRLSDVQATGAGLTESQALANPVGVRFLKVELPAHQIKTFFADVLTHNTTTNLTRKAISGLSIAGTNPDSCTNDPNCDGGGGGVNVICNYVPLAVLQNPVTLAPLDVNSGCPNTTQFTPGCIYTIRAQSNGNGNGKDNTTTTYEGSISAGNYQILAFNDDRGGSDARLAIASGFRGCYTMGSYILKVATEPGMKAGTVRQAINTRFNSFGGGLDAVDFPPDTNIKEGITYAQYVAGGSGNTQSPNNNLSVAQRGRRIVILPIINIDEFNNGRNDVRVFRFAPFFLRNSVPGGNGGEINAEYIGSPVNVGDVRYIPNVTSYNHGTNFNLATTVMYN